MHDAESPRILPAREAGKRVLLLGAGREGLDLLVDTVALGLKVVNINTKANFREAFLPYLEHAFVTDYHDADVLLPMARALFDVLQIDAVMSLTEEALVPAAQINDALALGGESLETVRLFKDKAMMRVRLNSAGISPVAAVVGTTRDDIAAFVAAKGLSIVKPVDGSGSSGIFRVQSDDDIDRALRELSTLGVSRFLVEEYLDGPEISVEAFSFDGRHIVVAITDKLVDERHVEVGHSMPSKVDEATRKQVDALIVQFLDGMGLRNGPTHTEIKLTARGPRIVESHNRVGGDRINELIRHTYGLSLKAHALAWSCGLVEAWATPPPPKGAAAIRFLTPLPGIVTDVHGVEEARPLLGCIDLNVTVAPGDLVRPVKSSGDRSGYVIAVGSNSDEAIRRCEAIVRSIRITTTQPQNQQMALCD